MNVDTCVPEWRRISEAIAWYPCPYNLTGAQVMAVVEGLRQALHDGRIQPEDVGMERVAGYYAHKDQGRDVWVVA